MTRSIIGTENYEDDRDHDHGHGHECRHDRDHDHDGDKGHEHHDKCWKYKKERDAYKDYLKAALERFGFAVRKLDHLVEDLVDGSKKIGRDHDKDDGKERDKDHDKHKEKAWD